LVSRQQGREGQGWVNNQKEEKELNRRAEGSMDVDGSRGNKVAMFES
jgi:hypothetical protein